MDMLPTNDTYYKTGLENFKKEDFIYYREVSMHREIYMCYNAAHPSTWSKVFGIENSKDISDALRRHYPTDAGVIGTDGWSKDQRLMYDQVMKYEKRHIMNRPIKRLESWDYERHISNGDTDFIKNYDDMHMHRSFSRNVNYISDARRQISLVVNNEEVVNRENQCRLFMTFGGPTERYHERVKTVCDQAKSIDFFTRVVGITDNFLKKDTDYWNLHGKFIESSRRGYGNYMWKPYIIKRFMDDLKDDDLLVYIDSGCTVNGMAR
jgi:IS1 family transposase